MSIKIHNPTSSGQRGVSYVDYSVLTRKKPERSLTMVLTRHAGRDKTGKISIRHQGAGRKRRYRLVEFGQRYFGQPAEIKSLEYDPYRSAFIALIQFSNGRKAYILAPHGILIGQTIVTADKTPVKIGNRMKLANIPTGVAIHNLEIVPGSGGKIVRSAGTQATIQSREDKYILVKLPSGEVRKLHRDCFATIGEVSNPDHGSVSLGKAGRVRHMGIRPTVRGKAMYPAAHPHGGGEGVSPIGLKHPKTFTGQPARGVKTRNPRKSSSSFIIKRRK